LDDFHHRDTKVDERRYRRHLMLILMGLSLSILILYLAADMTTGRYASLPSEGVSLLAVSAIFIMLLVKVSERVWTACILGLNFVALPLVLFDPHCWYIELIVLFVTVPVMFQLLKVKTALWVVGGQVVLLLSCWWAAYENWALDWTVRYSPYEAITLLVVYGFLTLISASSAFQYQRNVSKLLNLTLYYPVSGLPRRVLLVEALTARNTGILALIRCVNQFDLALVHGTVFSHRLVGQVAEYLTSLARKTSSQCFHLRDNEFALFIPQPENLETNPLTFLTRLHDELERLVFEDGIELNLQISVGAVEISGEPATCLSAADQALRTAERTRLPVYFFHNGDQSLETATERLSRFAVLRRALDQCALTVLFQPICSARSKTAVWYEALLRVPGPSGRLESIYSYLTTAETTGLMPRLTLEVIRQASQFIQKNGFPVSINLSFSDAQNDEIKHSLIAHAKSAPPGSFIIELLERDDVRTDLRFPQFLEDLKAAGCLFAIDDFGAGYSNFSTLADFPLEIVKLDGELVKKCASAPKTLMLVSSIIHFCKEADLKIVAEHIDSFAMCELFRNLGVDYLQGYYFGYPETADAIGQRDEEWVRESS
jgi:EAL domain-containing protein (putative c-di-GMP-specific phosphodiesterase class I)/GGDEF domain-containing protein